MIFPFRFKSLAFLGLAASLFFSSCKDDQDKAAPQYQVPGSYAFEHVDYSGPQIQIAMLEELAAYIDRGNRGELLDAQQLRDLYANLNSPFSSAYLNQSGQRLKDKTIATARAEFEAYLDALAYASVMAGLPAAPGMAGILTSTTDPARQYLVDEHGVEPGQLIYRGLMGAVCYYQVVEGHLSSEKLGPAVDNTSITPGKGTAMEHRWDEAFGYFGAPKDFPANQEDLHAWASYSNQVDVAIGSNKKLMDAYLKGRAAISAKDMIAKNIAANGLRGEWERLVAAAVIHVLNAAKSNLADQALKSHYLSEAKGLLMGLPYKPDSKLTTPKYNQVLASLGTDFYETTEADVTAAIDLLSGVYGLEDVKAAL